MTDYTFIPLNLHLGQPGAHAQLFVVDADRTEYLRPFAWRTSFWPRTACLRIGTRFLDPVALRDGQRRTQTTYVAMQILGPDADYWQDQPGRVFFRNGDPLDYRRSNLALRPPDGCPEGWPGYVVSRLPGYLAALRERVEQHDRLAAPFLPGRTRHPGDRSPNSDATIQHFLRTAHARLQAQGALPMSQLELVARECRLQLPPGTNRARAIVCGRQRRQPGFEQVYADFTAAARRRIVEKPLSAPVVSDEQ